MLIFLQYYLGSEYPISPGERPISPHHQAMFKTPVRCPAIQLNSNTIYPKIASESTGKDSVAQDHPPLRKPIASWDCASD